MKTWTPPTPAEVKDIIVVTPDEFERRKDIVGTVAYPAHHEGRVLYERPRP
jgi:hypothetical protein